MWREMVVGKRFPVRKQRDAQFGCEPRNLFAETLRGVWVAGDYGNNAIRTRTFARKLRQRKCVGRPRIRPGGDFAAWFRNRVIQRRQCGEVNGIRRQGQGWRVGRVQARNYTGADSIDSLQW